MRTVVWSGALGAMALGLLSGMAINPGPSDGDIAGPQLVYSSARQTAPANDSAGWWSVREGPVGEWVYGTDWVHPKIDPIPEQVALQEPAPTETAPTPAVAPVAYVSIVPTT